MLQARCGPSSISCSITSKFSFQPSTCKRQYCCKFNCRWCSRLAPHKHCLTSAHHCNFCRKKKTPPKFPAWNLWRSQKKKTDDFWNIKKKKKILLQNIVWSLARIAYKPSWNASLCNWCGWSHLSISHRQPRLIVGCVQSTHFCACIVLFSLYTRKWNSNFGCYFANKCAGKMNTNQLQICHC